MSRSYRKFLSWQSSEFEPVEWPGIRERERRCIHDVFLSGLYDEVLFPLYHRTHQASWSGSSRIYQSKKEIRDGYFKEIRDILNGFQDRGHWRNKDYQEIFIRDFNRIRNGESPEPSAEPVQQGSPQDGKSSYFLWLNNREAQNIIKNWKGDPLDVLYYLTSAGIIERAVSSECRRMSGK